MKKFPRMYAERTLKRMYHKLSLSEMQIDLLRNYFDAFANLYGTISMEEIFLIISQQNKGEISEESFLAFAEIARHEKHNYWVLSADELYKDATPSTPMERKLIHDQFLATENYSLLIQSHENKTYYIPDKDKLLRYADHSYFEQTNQTAALFQFFKRDMQLSKRKAEHCLYVTILSLSQSASFETCTPPFEEYKKIGNVSFTERQTEKFLSLYQNLYFHLRNAYQKGHTPSETGETRFNLKLPESIKMKREMIHADILRNQLLTANMPNEEVRLQMLADLLKIDPQYENGKKTSRNATCPCGSGKKYKRCCGK